MSAPAFPLVDTHCHLDFGDYGDEREQVIARGREAGVAWFVTIGSGRALDSAREARAIANTHPDIVATVGIHPHDAGAVGDVDAAVGTLGEHARDTRVVAIGEVGLDYHYDHSPRDVQRDVFRRCVALAREKRLPLVIHTRSAPEDTLEILRDSSARDVGGVIHCFTEDAAFARAALDLGFDISFSGIVTFKNSESLRAVARMVPLDRVLIETDAPYLAPVPKRGKRNEPAYVAFTAHHLAAAVGITEERFAQATTENAKRRFGLERFERGE